MKAISIRQPWAWLVVHGHKDIENRTWATKYRGKTLIHASGHKITRVEYDDFVGCCRAVRIKSFPAINGFKTSRIVGSVELVVCVEESKSRWYFGPYGFVLKNAKKLPFRQMKGKLNIWNV